MPYNYPIELFPLEGIPTEAPRLLYRSLKADRDPGLLKIVNTDVTSFVESLPQEMQQQIAGKGGYTVRVRCWHGTYYLPARVYKSRTLTFLGYAKIARENALTGGQLTTVWAYVVHGIPVFVIDDQPVVD